LATRLGIAAIRQVETNNFGVVVGLVNGEVSAIPLSDTVTNKKVLDLRLIEMARILAQ
jgi:6-phosphofructokinase 1